MKLSPAELAEGILRPETLASAIDQVRNNGYVLFEAALPADLVREMHASFIRSLDAHRAKSEANRGANRFQMHVPFEAPFSDERVIASPLVLPVVDALVGKSCICHYMASDTPLKGSDYQAAHADIYPLFPELPVVMPPYSIVVNIPLVEVTEDNGPLEIWPGGSHHYVADRAKVPELAATMHSERLLCPAGSILIRDSRMWHRGTPNRTDHPRPNFALIYSRHWLRIRYRRIPISLEAYGRLSERAKRLFRLEDVGGPSGTGEDLTTAQFNGTPA